MELILSLFSTRFLLVYKLSALMSAYHLDKCVCVRVE